jgi:hypothetical protein
MKTVLVILWLFMSSCGTEIQTLEASNSVTLTAARKYNPNYWNMDSEYRDGNIIVPAEIIVTSGNPGNHYSRLGFDTPSGFVLCWYKGNGVSYVFELCDHGAAEANDIKYVSGSIVLDIQESVGDTTTSVTVRFP